MFNLTKVKDLSAEDIENLYALFKLKSNIFNQYSDAFRGKVMSLVFFEPSTRTRFSFQSAFQKLGGTVTVLDNIESSRTGSSYGESIEDLSITLSRLSDLIIFRTASKIDMEKMKNTSNIPVISAGGGDEEHPTQALIDLFTIREYFGRVNNLNIVICGNLKERTIKSLIIILNKYRGNRVYLVAPYDGRLDSSFLSENTNNLALCEYYESYNDLKNSIKGQEVHAIYQEVLSNEHNQSQEKNKSVFYLDRILVDKYFSNSIILHPLPRGKELPASFDEYKNSKYFQQVTNGLYVRASILLYLLVINKEKLFAMDIIKSNDYLKFESSARRYSKTFPKIFEKGKIDKIWDSDGVEYLDFLQSAGSNILGHNEPAINDKVSEFYFGEKLKSTLDLITKERIRFIDSLFKILPGTLKGNTKIHFCSPSGSDAVEAAIKLAAINTQKTKIISFSGAYHGMTLASLFASDEILLHEKVSLVNPKNFIRLPFPTKLNKNGVIKMIVDEICSEDRPALIIVEPILGEGGVHKVPTDWMKKVRELCDKNNILLAFDEIQCGVGRTGKFFACEWFGVEPDILLLSKGIGGGVPISLLLYKNKFDVWEAGDHAGTNRGFQAAFIAGQKIIEIIAERNFLSSVLRKGDKFKEKLEIIKSKYKTIKEVRQFGLMIGVSVDRSKYEDAALIIQKKCFELGLMHEVGGKNKDVLRLLPPLNLLESSIDDSCQIIEEAVKQYES